MSTTKKYAQQRYADETFSREIWQNRRDQEPNPAEPLLSLPHTASIEEIAAIAAILSVRESEAKDYQEKRQSQSRWRASLQPGSREAAPGDGAWAASGRQGWR